MTGSSTAVVTVTNPFVGPRPIETGQKIFGRDREIEHLYFLLSAERIVLLHSPSGAGKSSLIQAGLLPRLTQLFDVWGPTRVNLQPHESDSAAVNRYTRSANLGFEARIPKERQRQPELISAMTLSEYVAGRPRRRSAPPNIVLLFDQFEEILTVDPLAMEAKHEFFEQVGKLLQDPHMWALFALREDYLAPLDPYAQQVPSHLKNRFRLDLLEREGAREAISRSVEEGGRSFVSEAVGKLVNDLATMQVQRPDGTFESQTGPYVEPLHLQVACRGLWERLPEDRLTIDLDDIQSFGDVTKALAEYYEKEVAGIAGGDAQVGRAIREWVGGKLITPDGIRGQVLKGAGKSEGLDNELIGRLVDTHLVRGEQRAGAVWYELSHDRLIEPVRTSNTKWFEDHLHKVQKIAKAWDAEGRPADRLLRGEELKEAQGWAEAQGGLIDVEQRFLAASDEAEAAAEEKYQQAHRFSTLAIAALLVLCLEAQGLAIVFALIAGFVAWREWKENRFGVERGHLKRESLRFERRVAATLAGIVVVLAIVAFFHLAAANDELKNESEKTEEWDLNQSTMIMRRLAELARDTLASTDPAKSVVYEKKATRFKEQLDDASTRAHDFEEAISRAERVASRLYLGQVLLEIAALLGALAIVTKRQKILAASIVVAVTGLSFAALAWRAWR
jgi:Novel STAND NTPase 1/Domain of unknown function (DUF4337)